MLFSIDFNLFSTSFGEFIASKLYKEYVDLKKPSSEDLAYLVSYFRKHNFDIPEMLRGVLHLKSFWENKLSLVKSPLDLFYGTARTFNVSGNLKSEFPDKCLAKFFISFSV